MASLRRLCVLFLASASFAGVDLGGAERAEAAVVREALTPTPSFAPRPAIPLRQLWLGAGVIVDDTAAFPAERARVLGRNRFRWVAVKVHDGLRRLPANEASLVDGGGWAGELRQEGLRVCGWGTVDRRPVREARLVAGLVRRLGLDCYIADAEDPYMGTGYSGVVARSAIFARAFRARVGSLPAAVTTYGAAVPPWILPFDYGSWRDRGFALLPQAYLPIASHYGPGFVAAHAVRAGYPRGRVHPVIGIGWTQGRRKHWGGDYVWRLDRAGTTGFSVFLGETTSDADFDVLGRAIARFGLAR